MARAPRDPLIRVIRYFQEVPLEAAKAALVVVADTVHRRLQEAGQLMPRVRRKVKGVRAVPVTDLEMLQVAERINRAAK